MSRKRAAALGVYQAAPNRLFSMKYFAFLTTSVFALGSTILLPSSSLAASAGEISQSARTALRSLYASNPAAQLAGKKAKAVLVCKAR
jgi:hypothetical protein